MVDFLLFTVAALSIPIVFNTSRVIFLSNDHITVKQHKNFNIGMSDHGFILHKHLTETLIKIFLAS